MSEVRMIPPASSDGSEAYLSSVRAVRGVEARFQALRGVVTGRPMACPDCRALRDAMVILMDTLAGDQVVPLLEEDVTGDKTTARTGAVTTHHANSDVTTVPAPVPTPGAAQGGEVAPGVVIIPPP